MAERKISPVTSKRSTNLLLPLFLFVLVALGAFGTYYFYNQYQTVQKGLKNPQESAKLEVEVLAERVGKLIVLPKDETPTVATVTDTSKLKNQQFFSKSANGDKVLIYVKAKKAVLYRPSANKIIEVATINLENRAKLTPVPTKKPTTAPEEAATATPTP